MESLLIGLLGVLIGAGASVATVWIQANAQTKRDRLRLVMELALEDHKSSIELAKASGILLAAPPVTLYLHYHLELAKLMESGKVTTDGLESVMRENRKIDETIERMQTERQTSTNG